MGSAESIVGVKLDPSIVTVLPQRTLSPLSDRREMGPLHFYFVNSFNSEVPFHLNKQLSTTSSAWIPLSKLILSNKQLSKLDPS
jgi:hypothetical protein